MADFDTEWMRLGYPDEMGSAKFLRPPEMGLIRAYHFTSAEHAIENIRLQRLKVARFSELNDPFELLSPNSHSVELRRLLEDNKNAQYRTTGLLCFSKNWTNPLLWSHYAEKHKGLCLGFDLSRDDIVEVSYENQRPRIESNMQGALQVPCGLQDRLRRTKYIDWEYEQELRRFIDLSEANQESDLYFLPFGEGLRLREVIIGTGSSCSLETIRRLTDVEVFKTRLERRGFRIVGDGRYPPQGLTKK